MFSMVHLKIILPQVCNPLELLTLLSINFEQNIYDKNKTMIYCKNFVMKLLLSYHIKYHL